MGVSQRQTNLNFAPVMETFYIKNMVCARCIRAVQEVVQAQQLPLQRVELGEVILSEPISSAQKKSLEEALKNLGFAFVSDAKSILLQKVKNLVVDTLQNLPLQSKMSWSKIIGQKVNNDYYYLSHLFSTVEGITLEQFIIRHKIEKAKELLFYNELTLSEIANLLDYSSVAHLSGQFKKITGMTPSAFKANKTSTRKTLDAI
jgi:hypothetical protein